MVGGNSKGKSKIIRKGKSNRLKSKTFRKIFVKTPGGKTVVHFKKKKPSKAVCARCNKMLHGVARERPYKMKKMAKTKKRPTRPFGGYYCGRCMKEVIKEMSK